MALTGAGRAQQRSESHLRGHRPAGPVPPVLLAAIVPRPTTCRPDSCRDRDLFTRKLTGHHVTCPTSSRNSRQKPSSSRCEGYNYVTCLAVIASIEALVILGFLLSRYLTPLWLAIPDRPKLPPLEFDSLSSSDDQFSAVPRPNPNLMKMFGLRLSTTSLCHQMTHRYVHTYFLLFTAYLGKVTVPFHQM